MEPLTQAQVQAQFDLAIDEGLSPCMWIPPKWAELDPKDKPAGPKTFANNSKDRGFFESAEAIKKKDERIKKGGDIKIVQVPESDANEESWPNPFADTSHIDETEFSAQDRDAIKTLNPSVLAKLNRIVGLDSPGMKRLGRIFEWALYRATLFMGELNTGLTNENEYLKARENYINFLRDLDDHEPEKGPKLNPRELKENEQKAMGVARLQGRPTKLDALDKKSASGYGGSIKWTCIEPVIFEGKIVGTRVVVKWNPHISSSGVAVNH
jgi:hypothetical protein